MRVLLNLAAFQVLWLALVLGAAHGWEWVAMVLLLAWLPAHLLMSPVASPDLRLFVVLGLLGPLVDSALVQAELVRFRGAAPHPAFAPFWIAALWANFALTLNHSMSWIRSHLAAASVFGALGGPLSYYVGARLGAAELSEPAWQPLAVLGLIWAAVVPGLGWLLRPAQHEVRT